MKLDDCKQCKHHVSLNHGEVLCNYWGQLSSLATDIKKGEIVLVLCPREGKQSKAS